MSFGETEFHIHGLSDQLTELQRRLDNESSLSSLQFWYRYYDQLTQLAEADSVSNEKLIQTLFSMLNAAGVAIEHLETRVAALEAGSSASSPEKT